VTTRTVRNDVERLRELGCPVNATRGAVGGYRLGAGAAMPPLLGMLGADFEVTDSPDLVAALRTLSDRYNRAAS
jgi:predicted DNA-binding transcriptional regulator YafY